MRPASPRRAGDPGGNPKDSKKPAEFREENAIVEAGRGPEGTIVPCTRDVLFQVPKDYKQSNIMLSERQVLAALKIGQKMAGRSDVQKAFIETLRQIEDEITESGDYPDEKKLLGEIESLTTPALTSERLLARVDAALAKSRRLDNDISDLETRVRNRHGQRGLKGGETPRRPFSSVRNEVHSIETPHRENLRPIADRGPHAPCRPHEGKTDSLAHTAVAVLTSIVRMVRSLLLGAPTCALGSGAAMQSGRQSQYGRQRPGNPTESPSRLFRLATTLACLHIAVTLTPPGVRARVKALVEAFLDRFLGRAQRLTFEYLLAK